MDGGRERTGASRESRVTTAAYIAIRSAAISYRPLRCVSLTFVYICANQPTFSACLDLRFATATRILQSQQSMSYRHFGTRENWYRYASWCEEQKT